MRQYLTETPGLEPLAPNGQPDATVYLEHGRHEPAVVRRLLEKFALPSQAEVDLEIEMHARYDTQRNPPDRFRVRVQAPASTGSVHLWNWTGAATSGYHYDGLVSQRCPPPLSWT